MALAGGAAGTIRIAFAVGSIIAGLLPKPRPPLPELRFQTSETGKPLPILYGTNRLAGNMIWIGNFKDASGGKGSKGGAGKGGGKGGQSSGPVYTASFAVGICEGQVQSVLSVWQDNKVVLSKGQTTQNLAGGGKGGKFGKGSQPNPGTVTFYFGDGTNTADPTISQYKGSGIGVLANAFTESFGAGTGSGQSLTYQVVNGPIQNGSDAVYWLNPTWQLLIRVASSPTYGQYSISSGGLVTLGPGPTTGTPWFGQTVFVGYTSVTATQNVADQNVPGYPYSCIAVFTNWVLGKAARVPNFTYEVTRIVTPVALTSRFQLQIVLSGANNGMFQTTDDSTYAEFGPPNFLSAGIVQFWTDEFTPQNSIAGKNGTPTQLAMTTNFGASWTYTATMPGNPASDAYRNFCVLPSGRIVVSDDVVGAVKMYTSDDGGATWSVGVLLPSQTANMFTLNNTIQRLSDGSLLVVGYDETSGTQRVGIYKSTDNGTSWALTYSNNTFSDSEEVACSYKQTSAGDVVFLCIADVRATPPVVKVYRSLDLGATFQHMQDLSAQSGGTNLNFDFFVDFRNTPGYCPDGSWLMLPTYYNIAAAHDEVQAFRSTDGGTTWVAEATAPAALTAGSGVWSDATTTYCGGRGGGPFRSSDSGRTWAAFSPLAGQVSAMFATPYALVQNAADANPSDIVYDLLTNTRYGGGVPTTAVDLSGTFTSAKQYYAHNGILLSPVFRDHKPLLTHIEDLLVLCDTFLVNSQGLFKLIPRQQAQSVRSITTASLTKDKDVVVNRIGVDSIANRVLVHYSQRHPGEVPVETTSGVIAASQKGQTTTANLYTLKVQEAKDAWTIEGDVGQTVNVGGRGTELVVGADGITSDFLASLVAYRILWARAFNRLQAIIPVGPQDSDLEPADVISWTDADLGLSGVLMRVMAVDQDGEGRLSLQCLEENQSILGWTGSQHGTSGTLPIPVSGSAPSTISSIFEMTPAQANGNGSILALLGGVDRLWAGAALYGSDDGLTYTKITQAAGTPVGYLAASVPDALYQAARSYVDLSTAIQVTLLTPGVTLLSVTDAQWRQGANQLVIGSEVIYYQNATLVSGSTWKLTNLIRGAAGTNPSSYVVNTLVWALGVNTLVFTPQPAGAPLVGLQPLFGAAIAWNLFGRTISLKAATIDVSGGQQSLANVTASSLVYGASGGMPLDVEGLVAAGGYGDSDSTVEVAAAPNRNLALSWAYQSPAIQEDMDFVQGNSPAHDVKFSQYRIVVADASGNVKNTYTSATESFTYTEAMNTADFGVWTSVVQITVKVANSDGGLSSGVTVTYTMLH